MEIRNFDRVRVGGGYPYCFDVQKITPDVHTNNGVLAITYEAHGDGIKYGGYIEIRKYKLGIIIINTMFGDIELPDWVAQCEVIWTNRKEPDNAPG